MDGWLIFTYWVKGHQNYDLIGIGISTNECDGVLLLFRRSIISTGTKLVSPSPSTYDMKHHSPNIIISRVHHTWDPFLWIPVRPSPADQHSAKNSVSGSSFPVYLSWYCPALSNATPRSILMPSTYQIRWRAYIPYIYVYGEVETSSDDEIPYQHMYARSGYGMGIMSGRESVEDGIW